MAAAGKGKGAAEKERRGSGASSVHSFDPAYDAATPMGEAAGGAGGGVDGDGRDGHNHRRKHAHHTVRHDDRDLPDDSLEAANLLQSTRKVLPRSVESAVLGGRRVFGSLARVETVVAMFLFGRVLIPHVILKPWEVDLCRKPGKRAQENFKVLASVMWIMLWRIFPSFDLKYNATTLSAVAGIKTSTVQGKDVKGKLGAAKKKSLAQIGVKAKKASMGKSMANLLLRKPTDAAAEHPDWYSTETEYAALFHKKEFFGAAWPLILEWIDRETRRLRQLVRLIALRVIAED
uniref:Uncharacterized protein n=1 Tax=Bicosoecida sp. CB-2014 TaxID=1486930 RepID=A0A7S1CBL3_9STRA